MPAVKGNVKIIDNTAYEIIPSERGYAYWICIATAINLICCFSHMNSTGMLYNDFLIEHGGGVSGLSTVSGVYQGLMAISGITTNLALKKFSLRQVGLFGAFLYTSSWFFNTFINSMYQLVITFGIMQGLGQGILTTVSLTVFNQYFVKKSMMMYALCQILVAIMTMLFPLFLEHTLKEYGFRGSILILSAIASHAILCTISMHPIEWHSKWKVLYSIVSTEDYVNEQNTQEYKLKVIDKEFTVKRVDDNLQQSNTENREDTSGLFYQIIAYMDFLMLADLIFLNIVTGVVTFFFSDFSFFLIYPAFLYSLGLETSEVATYLTAVSATDLAGRIFLVIISKFLTIKNRNLLLYGTIMSTIAKIVFLQCDVGWSLFISSMILGFFRCFFPVICPVIIAEYNPEKFTAAFGLIMTITGAFTLIGLPIIGFLRDFTESFVITFYVLSAISIPSMFLWTFEIYYFKRKQFNI